MNKDEKFYKESERFLKKFKVWTKRNVGSSCKGFNDSCLVCQTWLIIGLWESWLEERLSDEKWAKK